MMEHQDREQLTHRINVCGQVARFFQLGTFHVDISKQSMPCSIVRHNKVLYSFDSFDECEDWCNAIVAAEWPSRVKGTLLGLRHQSLKAKMVAEACDAAFYDVPSRMNYAQV